MPLATDWALLRRALRSLRWLGSRCSAVGLAAGFSVGKHEAFAAIVLTPPPPLQVLLVVLSFAVCLARKERPSFSITMHALSQPLAGCLDFPGDSCHENFQKNLDETFVDSRSFPEVLWCVDVVGWLFPLWCVSANGCVYLYLPATPASFSGRYQPPPPLAREERKRERQKKDERDMKATSRW